MNPPNPLAVIPAYLRQKKAAAYVGLSEQMLPKLVRKNEGPPRIRKGRAVLYSAKALDEWMERKRLLAEPHPNIGPTQSRFEPDFRESSENVAEYSRILEGIGGEGFRSKIVAGARGSNPQVKVLQTLQSPRALGKDDVFLFWRTNSTCEMNVQPAC